MYLSVYAAEQADAPWPLQLAWLLLLFVPWTVALRDTIKRSEAEFRAVGSSKTMWLLLLISLSLFAAPVYLITVRPRLKRMASSPG